MEVIILKNYNEISKKVAKLIANQIKHKSNSVLGLATGSTPIGVYEELVKKNNNNEISFKDVVTFNLDEYVGLDKEHSQSYRYFMNNHLFNKVDINIENTYVPFGLGSPIENSNNYENLLLNKGPIDLQILGIGTNAHIGFCEPGSPEMGKTSEVKLTNSTIKANKRFFDDISNVPKTAISMGIKSITNAKSIILLAIGETKAKAIKDTIEGKITNEVPASFLQKHSNTTLIIDEAAASLLKK